ncbi:hypothetical protein K440DRAFT_611184 [Wilcoxina mikolae CBS 423.85]|nr:hypothetical protein K440DRAFT_611184 [Wilcoxina mikolae CBS 423.85]
MRLPLVTLAAIATTAAATAGSASEFGIIPKMDELRCIEFEASRCGLERHTDNVVTSMPEQAPMVTDSSSHLNHDWEHTKSRRKEKKPEAGGGLTARQVVGGIAVAVLVAVV